MDVMDRPSGGLVTMTSAFTSHETDCGLTLVGVHICTHDCVHIVYDMYIYT